MPDLVWFNGEILPRSDVRIDLEDRGFQFADGVYEVIRLYDGRPFALTEHLERLERSANAIWINLPLTRQQLAAEVTKLLKRTGAGDGIVYMQLTRGCAPRKHLFPACPPTLLFHARPLPEHNTAEGISLISVPDERWSKCWIKAIALLPNVLARNEAAAAGADEAVYVHNGVVTECSSSNVFMVMAGRLVTHPVGPKVLGGITRLVLLDVARSLDIPVEERPVLETRALEAQEVFITSTTREIDWVRRWNGRTIGKGQIGPVTQRLHEAFRTRLGLLAPPMNTDQHR